MGQAPVSRPANPPIVVPDGALVAGRLDRNALAVTHGQHWGDQFFEYTFVSTISAGAFHLPYGFTPRPPERSAKSTLTFPIPKENPLADDAAGTTTP